MTKIYVISQAVSERMHTPRLLQAAGIPFTLVLDNAAQGTAAQLMGYTDIMCTPQAKGIVAKRNAITSYHRMKYDGWYIGMDDNIQELTSVGAQHLKKDRLPTSDTTVPWRSFFNKTCPPQQYLAHLESLIAECKLIGTVYGGVATMENPFFRGGRRYAFRRFVKTKVFVMDASASLQFKHAMCHDSYMTALTIARYGAVVVDQRLFYKARWYEKGGLGSREAREAAGLMQQLEACCTEFPGLVGLGKGKNTALRVLKTQNTSVDRWRKEHGYL